MIRFKLSEKTASLKPYLRDILLYSGITSVTVEIGDTQKTPDSIFIRESDCQTLEDVLSEFALKVFDLGSHVKPLKSSLVSLNDKYSLEKSKRIASVIETALEPVQFFVLGRVPIYVEG